MSPESANPLRILFVTSEITPFAKTGGLADVSASLPRALHHRGHDVRVVVPLYSLIDVDAWDFAPVPGLGDVSVSLGSRSFTFSLFQAPVPGEENLHVHFVHCPELYDRSSLYTNDPDEHLRFLLLTRAALEVCQRTQWSPSVVHANDWQSALLPIYVKTLYAWDRLFQDTGTVLTIHNLAYQGLFPARILADTDLEPAKQFLDQDDLKAGRLGFLNAGIRHADAITTVSPTYAREILDERLGMGLHELLATRRDALSGILNGVDTDIWNPRTDPHLPFRYSVKSLWRKEKCKEALLAELDLPYEKRVPVVGAISRLVGQKGFDLLEKPLPELLRARDFRVVVLGSGEPRLERFLARLEAEFPEKVRFRRGYDGTLAHRIEAGSDMFLMPSYFEPCGLNQMYSQLYGTVPVVHKTGGLADTVDLWNPDTGEGTGIVFDHPTPEGVRWALGAGLDLHADQGVWKRIVANAMAQDFSWSARVLEYEAVYERVRAGKREATGANV